MFAPAPDEPLPALDIFAEVLEYETPPGTYFDAYDILIISRQSLESLARHRPQSSFEVSRFRPNILVDIPGADSYYPEESWAGKRVAIGDVVLEVVGECPRCAMTTHGFLTTCLARILHQLPEIARSFCVLASVNVAIATSQ